MAEPDFTQIPLNNQRLIALDDLKAVSGYNRNLIVPDDLPPVLSLPQVQAPLKPRLVTGQEDGSVNVFLTGGGGGSSGLSINNLQQIVFADLYGNRPGDSQASKFFTQAGMVILAMDLFWHWDDFTIMTGSNYERELHLATNSGTGDICLSAVHMISGGATGYAATTHVQNTFVFPGGLNPSPALSVGGDDQYLLYTHGAGGVFFGVLVCLYLGQTA